MNIRTYLIEVFIVEASSILRLTNLSTGKNGGTTSLFNILSLKVLNI